MVWARWKVSGKMIRARLLGGGFIACAIVWKGIWEARKLRERVEFLKAIVMSLETIKSEIAFGRYELSYIFGRLKPEKDRGFFALCEKHLDELGICGAWNNALDECGTEEFLKAGDISVIYQLGNELGKSDVGGQKNSIDKVVNELRKIIEMAEEDNQRLGKVYRGCSILLGVFIMIILL